MTLYSPEKVGSIKLYSSVFQQITPHNVAEKRRGGKAAILVFLSGFDKELSGFYADTE